jgi:hypothetical protein
MLVIMSVPIAVFFLFLIGTKNVFSHCDALDGPVINIARLALDKGDVTPVLKWVSKRHEQEIRDAFAQTLTVRAKGKEARELADRFFFETLVRIHRAGEGAPYTGLKPAGTVEPAIAAADNALQTGSVDQLANKVSQAVREGILKRFITTLDKKKHADESVEAGREFVEAYVDYVHFVEGIHQIVSQGIIHHSSERPHGQEHGH